VGGAQIRTTMGRVIAEACAQQIDYAHGGEGAAR
jgi:hypothetical protein